MRYEVIKQAIRPGKKGEANNPNRRFDVTLLFNGLPLIQIEEKRVDVNLKQAFNQIVKYKSENKYDGLYSAVQLFVTLQENNARYFANENSADFFNDKFCFEWLDKKNNHVRNWKQFTEEFLMIPMAHNIISNFTVVDGQFLKVLRPYQIHAVTAIREAFAKHQDGYIWHATGSGKTLTAYKVATLLQRDSNNQVIFLSDRTELDNQSGKNFNEFSANSDDTIFETNKTYELIKYLKSNKMGVITTTINKMKIAVEKHNEQVEQGNLEDELNEVAGLIEDCINENARVALDQSEYEKRYNGLVERFDKANGRLEKIKEQITERQARGQQIELFLKDLEKVGVIEQFDDDLFLALIESVEVSREKVIVRFKDGTEVEG